MKEFMLTDIRERQNVNHPILFIGRKLSKNDAREYVLADVDYRESEDLRNYKKIIHETINEMITGAKVIVRENKYTIYKPITSGQARRIGRSLALTELSEFAHRRAVLFEGREVAETRY